MSESKPDTVPGLGFKDKEKAQETIKNLEGRDPDYQKLAIKGLIGRAKRTLTLTKDKEKLQNINDAMKIFDDWLSNFEKLNLSKDNRPYLPLDSVKTLLPLKTQYKLSDSKADAFLKAYKEAAKGEYKSLRTVSSGGKDDPTWDIVRNKELKKILSEHEKKKADLWNGEDLPTKEHLQLIVWAYSPDATRIKKNLSKIAEKLGDSAGGSGSSEGSSSGGSEDEKRASKRKSGGKKSSATSSSEEETPKKKNKK